MVMIEIRFAEREHIKDLPEIERAAAALFGVEDLPAHLREVTVSENEHVAAQQQGLLLVALESRVKPIGFAIGARFGSFLHLQELDVHPNYQRHGVGLALLERFFALAKRIGCESVTLTTYKHVSWNAPWYQRQGFSIFEDDETPTWLSSVLAQEVKDGLNPQRRAAMHRPV